MYSDIEPCDFVPSALLRDTSRSVHETLCVKCGRKLDPGWIRADFRVSNRRRDITCTYDGYTLVSERFRSAWLEWNFPGAKFIELPRDPRFFALEATRILPFDAKAAATRFEEYCRSCRNYRVVVGAYPVRLKGIFEPLSPGLYRTDLAFASGIEQHSLLIVDPQVYMRIRAEKFVGFEFAKITA